MAIFLNHTNHVSENWSETQRKAAESYGMIQDIPFPAIPAEATKEEVEAIAGRYFDEIREINPAAVLCQGEFTYTFVMVRLLQEAGIKVLAACSERCTEELVDIDGISRKESIFRFVKFREY